MCPGSLAASAIRIAEAKLRGHYRFSRRVMLRTKRQNNSIANCGRGLHPADRPRLISARSAQVARRFVLFARPSPAIQISGRSTATRPAGALLAPVPGDWRT